MPFKDVGTTARKAMPQGRILRIWENSSGVCCLCQRPIEGTKEVWYVEHIRALELGGPDTDDNCAPAHYTCKPAKDREDHKRAAEAKREKADHLGIPKRSHLRGGGFKKAPPRRTASGRLNKWFGPSMERGQ